MEGLLWDRLPGEADIFRMKGVLNVAGSARQHLLQVQHSMHRGPEGCSLQCGMYRVREGVVLVVCRCAAHWTWEPAMLL